MYTRWRGRIADISEIPAKGGEMSVSVGDLAPDFTLEGTMDSKTTLSYFRGHGSVILVFYPVDDTPG